MTNEHVGTRIKRSRLRLDWSITELAKKAKIKQRTLEDIEAGVTKEPGYEKVMSVLQVLSAALGEPLVSFFIDDSGKGHVPAAVLSAKGMKSGLKQLQVGARNKANAQMARKLPTNFQTIGPKNYSPEDLAAGFDFVSKFASIPRDNQLAVMALVFENTTYLDQLSPEFLAQLAQLLSYSKK